MTRDELDAMLDVMIEAQDGITRLYATSPGYGDRRQALQNLQSSRGDARHAIVEAFVEVCAGRDVLAGLLRRIIEGMDDGWHPQYAPAWHVDSAEALALLAEVRAALAFGPGGDGA